jgi:uncharacterized protein (UPF0128 family)
MYGKLGAKTEKGDKCFIDGKEYAVEQQAQEFVKSTNTGTQVEFNVGASGISFIKAVEKPQPTQSVKKTTRIKTIAAQKMEVFDDEVNAFCQEKEVFATQTHYKDELFIAVCFYKE